ncbi:MAG: TetR/AcrR family transcriptional regulator [Chloroflexi bacterium]|nr:TetR/AcrR family transcriptional regulator [Chloroflexota bacterium]
MKENDIRTYSRNTELVSERREHIAKSVAPLFVKQGYERTTIRDIAKVCGMSMGHLYYYIGSKEDILGIMMDYDQHFYTDFVKQMIASYDSLSPTDALIKVIDDLYRGMAGIPDFTRFFYQEMKNLQRDARRVIMDRERTLMAEFEKMLQRGCDSGEFVINDLTLVANTIIVTGHMWVLRKPLFARGYLLDDYIRYQTENILKSISAYPKKKPEAQD